MSHREAKKERSLPFAFLTLSLFSLTVALSPSRALAQSSSCTAAETLMPGSVLSRQHDMPLAGNELVRIPISQPGALELYVSAGAASAVPRISFLGTDCGAPTGEGVSWVRVRETPRELHMLVRESGDLFALISSEDPEAPLSGYALHATFAAELPIPDEVIALTANPPASCQAEDLPTFSPQPVDHGRFVVLQRDGFTKDVDPWDDDGFSGVTAAGLLIIESPDAELKAALHDGDDCGLEQRLVEGSLDGGPVAAPVHAGAKRILLAPHSASGTHYDVEIRHLALCTEAGDDHPDRPLCASPITEGVEVTGLVTGGDEDHFTWVLDNQETVAVELAGDNGIRGALYDQDGQRLETWEAGHPEAARLVRTLGPGRFYVLVASSDEWVKEYTALVERLP